MHHHFVFELYLITRELSLQKNSLTNKFLIPLAFEKEDFLTQTNATFFIGLSHFLKLFFYLFLSDNFSLSRSFCLSYLIDKRVLHIKQVHPSAFFFGEYMFVFYLSFLLENKDTTMVSSCLPHKVTKEFFFFQGGRPHNRGSFTFVLQALLSITSPKI